MRWNRDPVFGTLICYKTYVENWGENPCEGFRQRPYTAEKLLLKLFQVKKFRLEIKHVFQNKREVIQSTLGPLQRP